jgi:hypothetical protein
MTKTQTIKLLIIMLTISHYSFGQLIITGGLPDDLSKQKYSYQIDTAKVKGDSVFVVVQKFDNDILIFQEEQIFIDVKVIFHGHSMQWYKNRRKKCEGTFHYGKEKNDWIYWDEDGNQVRESYFEEDSWLRGSSDHYVDGIKLEIKPTSSNCVTELDSVVKRKVYTLVDIMPEYSGGTSALLAFFAKNFVYPHNELDEFQGSIYLSFIIEADGKLSNINVYKQNKEIGLSSVDKEAIRVFQLMQNWKAGQCEGENVAVKMSMPIKF